MTRTPYRLRVDDFLLLNRAERFSDLGRTDLLAGQIYVMDVQHRPHAHLAMRLYDALREALAGHELAATVGTSVELSDHDIPQSDLTLTTAPDGGGPIPGGSVFLVIEVADVTLADDLGDKATLYASADIPEYWVADINARVIHQLWRPVDGVFTEQRAMRFGEPVTAATIADLTIATDRL